MATACFSMYSDMSKRIILSAEPKSSIANCLESSVLPTPVGPTKRKLPIGRFGAPNPTRLRRMALAILSTAASCPITCDLRSSARLRSCDCSFLSNHRQEYWFLFHNGFDMFFCDDRHILVFDGLFLHFLVFGNLITEIGDFSKSSSRVA